MRCRLWVIVVAVACRKEAAPPPAPPALVIADAAMDAATDAPIDAPADAAIDAPPDAAKARCQATECWLREEKRCAVPNGPLNGGVCGSPGGICSRCRCAAPWTPIDTPTGPRPIAELREGDLVLSLEGGVIVSVPVARTNRVAVTGHHASEITFDDGTQILVSAEHPLADGRMLGAVVAGELLGVRRVVRSELVAYPFDATHDILPASSTGVYFSRGVPLGSTLR